jgi:hypothetical protein
VLNIEGNEQMEKLQNICIPRDHKIKPRLETNEKNSHERIRQEKTMNKL